MPPSREALEQRLNGRGQDDPAVIAARMTQAVEEMSHFIQSDYLVVNNDFEQALAELAAIIACHRLATPRQQDVLGGLLNNLLN
jgi:guanylate kinase